MHAEDRLLRSAAIGRVSECVRNIRRLSRRSCQCCSCSKGAQASIDELMQETAVALVEQLLVLSAQ